MQANSEHTTDFRVAVQVLLGKYDGTPLLSRWQEAISFGAGLGATDFWIRDSDGVVNIVWINADGIRDVTMVTPPGGTDDYGDDNGSGSGEEYEATTAESEEHDDAEGEIEGEYEQPGHRESMFNFLPLRHIVSFEVREGEQVALRFGLGVSGNRLVHVIADSPGGQLYWVANTLAESQQLDHFLTSVLKAYLYSQ